MVNRNEGDCIAIAPSMRLAIHPTTNLAADNNGEYLEGEDWLWAVADREKYTLNYNELPKETKFDSGRKL